MQERELVKIASDNPAHPGGYYIQFKDRMRPGDVEYSDSPGGDVSDSGEPPTEPIKRKKRVKI